MSSTDVYRKRATECRRQADAAVTKCVRETLLELADKYLELATNAERPTPMSRPDGKRSGISPTARR